MSKISSFLKRSLFAAFLIPSLCSADPTSPAGTSITQIQDEGANVTRRQKLNFIGAGVNCVDNSGSVRTDCTITSGGGGTPGGSDTQLQYNNAGSFGGIATATFGVTTNTLTIGATTIFTRVSTTTWQNVSSVVVGDGALLDLSQINQSTNTEGIKLPQSTDCSNANTEGQACWDTDNDLLYIGGSAPTGQFPMRNTLTVGSTAYPDYLYVGSSATILGPLIVATTPILPGQATSKSYVDSVARGLSIKASVMMASTGTIALSGLQVIDGVNTVSADRILVKNQTLSKDNGIYLASSTAWVRSLDYDETSEVIAGTFMAVTTGTVNRNTQWVQISSGPTINVSSLTFVQLSVDAAYVAGNGLSLTNYVFSVAPGGVSLSTNVAGTLPVANGGTGAITLTSNGALYGLGTSAIGQTAAGANGTFLRSAGGAPAFSVINATDIAAGALGPSVRASSFPVTGVTSGSYTNTNLTVNSQGMITSATNGSSGTGTSIYAATATASFPFGFSASTGVFTSTLTANNFVASANGTINRPAFYLSDGNGMYQRTTNAVGITSNGSEKLDVSASFVEVLSVPLLVNTSILNTSGTRSLPGYSFSGDTDTGFLSPVANTIEATVGGISVATITATGVSVADNVYAAGWNGSDKVPTRNAVYDKIESLVTGASIYPATSTASFPFGFSASTGVFTSSVTARQVMISTTPGSFIGYRTHTGTLIGMYPVGNSDISFGSPASGGIANTYFSISPSLINAFSPVSILPAYNPSTYLFKIGSSSSFALSLSSTAVGATSSYVYDLDSSTAWESYDGLIVSTQTTYPKTAVWEVGGGPVYDPAQTRSYFSINMATFGATMGYIGMGTRNPSAKLSVAGHIQIATNTATNPQVSSCGTGPSIVGHDGAGKVTIGTGGAASSCTVTFGTAFTNAPSCSVQGTSSTFPSPSLTTTTTNFVITKTTPFGASEIYSYICIGWE